MLKCQIYGIIGRNQTSWKIGRFFDVFFRKRAAHRAPQGQCVLAKNVVFFNVFQQRGSPTFCGVTWQIYGDSLYFIYQPVALQLYAVALMGVLIKRQRSYVIHRPMCRLPQKRASLHKWFQRTLVTLQGLEKPSWSLSGNGWVYTIHLCNRTQTARIIPRLLFSLVLTPSGEG